MQHDAEMVSERPVRIIDDEWNPNDYVKTGKKTPSFLFKWGYPKEKNGVKLPKKLRGARRLIARPNAEMIKLHEVFGGFLEAAINAMGKEGTFGIRYFPSATGCVKESNPLLNAQLHKYGEQFYITDFEHAYPSVDLKRLAVLLVYIVKYDYYSVDCPLNRLDINLGTQEDIAQDPLFPLMAKFVQTAFGGFAGMGLAIGGPLSPYLLNLYCEVFLDCRMRYYLMKLGGDNPWRKIVYTRYVDDLVFSSGNLITPDMRRTIRAMINAAGFKVKHKKSFVLSRSAGTVFITKLGMRVAPTHLEDTLGEGENRKPVEGILTFPQKKRRRLRGIIRSYMATPFQNDAPEVICGLTAEFIHYWKNVKRKTLSDRTLMRQCKAFEKKAAPYLEKLRRRRTKEMERRSFQKKWQPENRLRALKQQP